MTKIVTIAPIGFEHSEHSVPVVLIVRGVAVCHHHYTFGIKKENRTGNKNKMRWTPMDRQFGLAFVGLSSNQ